MYYFFYDYVKPKYCEKAKMRYMDTVSLYLSKHGIFIKTLHKMLKLELILEIMNK